jgi:hypothetical protein
MVIRTESKPQGWRALVVFEDGSECLLYVGRSTTHVKNGYKTAYTEVLTEEERDQVRSISLQCWEGAPDRGRWLPKSTLPIPDGAKPSAFDQAATVASALAALENSSMMDADDDDEEEEPSAILPFRLRPTPAFSLGAKKSLGS